jgi:hypothetical protein
MCKHLARALKRAEGARPSSASQHGCQQRRRRNKRIMQEKYFINKDFPGGKPQKHGEAYPTGESYFYYVKGEARRSSPQKATMSPWPLHSASTSRG